MRCPICSTENLPTAHHCKQCGEVLRKTGVKTCQNGHNFDANLDACPYCPQRVGTQAETLFEVNRPIPHKPVASGDSTILESGPSAAASGDRTVIMGASAPAPAGSAPAARNDRTMIIGPGGATEKPTPMEPSAPAPTPVAPSPDGLRKLVGWLVTFDIQPTGLDFRLYVGKHRIGRSPKCDIVINQPWISDEHCVILYRDGKFLLQDLVSVNGTFLNDEMVEDKAYLNDNDIIRLGKTSFKLRTV